jgi:hypothetical protein
MPEKVIQRIRTALTGGEPRAGAGRPAERREADDDAGETLDVRRADPFRPEFDSASGRHLDDVDMDRIFGVLGNSRRRYVLNYLSTREGTVTMSDLAEQVAAWECGKPTERLGSKERKRVYVSLYQSHLPKMAEASAVAYDKDRGEIERGERFEQYGHYLRREE